MNLQHFYTNKPISICLIAKENWTFPWIDHYSRVIRNQLSHSNISSGKKTILINTFANIDNFLFKRICNLRLVTGSQKIGPLIIFLWFKLFLLVVQFYQLGLFMELFDNLLWTKIGPQKCPMDIVHRSK